MGPLDGQTDKLDSPQSSERLVMISQVIHAKDNQVRSRHALIAWLLMPRMLRMHMLLTLQLLTLKLPKLLPIWQQRLLYGPKLMTLDLLQEPLLLTPPTHHLPLVPTQKHEINSDNVLFYHI